VLWHFRVNCHVMPGARYAVSGEIRHHQRAAQRRRVSDWMGGRFSFLRCGADHHTVSFVRYEEARLHHMAFEVRDMAELQRSCDFLASILRAESYCL